MRRPAYRPPWMAPWATPGTGRSGFQGVTARSPTMVTSGCPGTVRSGCTGMRPARSVASPSAFATARPNGVTCTPAAHSTVRAARCSRTRAVVMSTPSARDGGHPGAGPHGRARGEQVARRPAAKRRADRSAAPGPSPPPARCAPCVGSMERNSRRNASRATSPRAPASSTPGGSATHDHEGHPRLARVRISLPLGALEGEQDAPPDGERIVDGLEARCQGAPSRRARTSCAGCRSPR